MTSSPDQHPDTTPLIIRYGAILLSVIAAISTLPWMYLSMGRFGGFAWGLFGFELMVLLGALMTVMVCIGKVRVQGAFPLALTCFAGTLLVASVFGIHVDARSLIDGNHPTVAPWVNRTLMLYLAIIAVLTLIAMLDVYRRSASSWGLVVRAVIFLVPVLAVGVYVQRSGFPSIQDSAGELSVVRMVSMILGGIVLGILMSVGGHFLIRSFEVSLPEKTAVNDA